MRERISELGFSIWWTVIAVIVLSILALGGLAIQRIIYPWWLSIQRESVESSKSFTDANNNMLETYKLEHSRLDTKIAEAGDNVNIVSAYKSQQMAIIEKMCHQISTMKKDTINPSTLTWLNNKGGCK